jgi:hypothetical protein
MSVTCLWDVFKVDFQGLGMFNGSFIENIQSRVNACSLFSALFIIHKGFYVPLPHFPPQIWVLDFVKHKFDLLFGLFQLLRRFVFGEPVWGVGANRVFVPGGSCGVL